MARKVKPELLVNFEGNLGIKKGDKFETVLNFDFTVTHQVSLGAQAGSGAVYKVFIPGEEPRYSSL